MTTIIINMYSKNIRDELEYIIKLLVELICHFFKLLKLLAMVSEFFKIS